MPQTERTGLLNTLATAFTGSRTRQAQQEEAETCLCAARLHTLGLAIHAYQEDHGGELPRKFVRPPGDRLLTAGWGPLWYEASLSEYLTDADTYFCPRVGCYAERVPLLLRDGPRQLLRPAPEAVVVYCDHHATRAFRKEDSRGEYIVLRRNGTVERLPSVEVETWRYADGRWYPPAGEAVPEAHCFPVFPGEPWPPTLETVPVPNRPWEMEDGEA